MIKFKHRRIMISLALFFGVSFPNIADAADTYPTVSFVYPIIDQRIIEALTFGDNNFQSISVTPYIYGIGNDPTVNNLEYEERGYHIFYISQNEPAQILNLNNENINFENQMFYWEISDSDRMYNGYLSDYPFAPHLSGYLTNIQSTNVDLEVRRVLPVSTLQSWIDLVDTYLADGSTRFSRNDVNYLDFHRQIGYVDDNSLPAQNTTYQFLADSYFRVYRTGFFNTPTPTPAPVEVSVRKSFNLQFSESLYGTDKLSDPDGQLRKTVDTIDAKYGHLIK